MQVDKMESVGNDADVEADSDFVSEKDKNPLEESDDQYSEENHSEAK